MPRRDARPAPDSVTSRTFAPLAAVLALAACGRGASAPPVASSSTPSTTTGPDRAAGVPCTADPAANDASSGLDQSAGAHHAHDARLVALFDGEWEYDMQESPESASFYGDKRYASRWDDLSAEARARRHAHDQALAKTLAAFDPSALGEEDRLNLTLFTKDVANRLDEFEHKTYLFPLNPREGIQTAYDVADAIPFRDAADYRAWTSRLEAFGAHVDQTIDVLREGIRARMVHPRVVMKRVVPQLDKQIVQDPTKSPFFAPFAKMPKTFPERDHLALDAQKAITGAVVPAFERLRAFLVKEYLPACTEQVGAWQFPDGDAYYRAAARRYTTTEMTPEEIHKTGLAEVERIHGEMLRVMAEVGYKKSLKEFFAFLRTDKRFFYATSEELFAGYEAVAKRIDPALVKVFKRLPRAPYGVLAIPSVVAPDTTTAYYRSPSDDGSRAGTYFVNLFKPEARPKWEMMALSLHEAVPGHHLQIALAMEQPDVPKFRAHGGYTAFVEGWALYAESLGGPMGLYDDPYARFGQLTYEMWRAVRLVVDSGMHAMRWDRQRAIDFFMENAPKQELDVVNEVDRYITWPGQALAYKIGELRIKALRDRAAQALGPRFDLREFHDVVLRHGALPLDVLEHEVDAYIAATRG
jgi:uncharacterized protein (DUF885 family)